MNVRSEILQFLRAPQTFAHTLPGDDAPVWRQGLEGFAEPQIAEKGDYPLRQSQVAAWKGFLAQTAENMH